MKALWTGNGEVRMAPDSALILRGNPWFLPDDGTPGEWRGRIVAAACIDRLGMHIGEKFAPRYYSEITLAVHPCNQGADMWLEWVRDGALVTGEGRVGAEAASVSTVIAAGSHTRTIDGGELLASFNRAIAAVSRYVTLKTGDMILLDTQLPDIALREGVDFDVMFGGERMLHFKTR